MKIDFTKYEANGNDFILTNETEQRFKLSEEQIAALCHRRFGVGADGLIRIFPSEKYDFEMKYYNSDGREASMCGNGGRCVAAEAFRLGIAGKEMTFLAFDGPHKALITEINGAGTLFYVELQMNGVESIEKGAHYYFLDTGSPHYVEFVDKVAETDVVSQGRKTRYSELFAPGGTNVNFAELSGDRLFVRTYERGVEDETLSCGTGVTASAIAAYLKTGKKVQLIHTPGGDFKVDFTEENGRFKNILLKGPARLVFTGNVDLENIKYQLFKNE